MRKKYYILGGVITAFVMICVMVYYIIQMKGNKSKEGVTLVNANGSSKMAEYKSITMDEAKTIFEKEGDYIILDVRRPDEFAEGHIPGALNIANEDINTTEPEKLPDKSQTIYVYCRSGNRSRQAAAKLAAMGYTNIIECGGIIDYTGNVSESL